MHGFIPLAIGSGAGLVDGSQSVWKSPGFESADPIDQSAVIISLRRRSTMFGLFDWHGVGKRTARPLTRRDRWLVR